MGALCCRWPTVVGVVWRRRGSAPYTIQPAPVSRLSQSALGHPSRCDRRIPAEIPPRAGNGMGGGRALPPDLPAVDPVGSGGHRRFRRLPSPSCSTSVRAHAASAGLLERQPSGALGRPDGGGLLCSGLHGWGSRAADRAYLEGRGVRGLHHRSDLPRVPVSRARHAGGGAASSAGDAGGAGLRGARACVARLPALSQEANSPPAIRDAPPPAQKKGIAALLFAVASGVDHLLPVLVLTLGMAGHANWVLGWLLVYSLGDFLVTQATSVPRPT